MLVNIVLLFGSRSASLRFCLSSRFIGHFYFAQKTSKNNRIGNSLQLCPQRANLGRKMERKSSCCMGPYAGVAVSSRPHPPPCAPVATWAPPPPPPSVSFTAMASGQQSQLPAPEGRGLFHIMMVPPTGAPFQREEAIRGWLVSASGTSSPSIFYPSDSRLPMAACPPAASFLLKKEKVRYLACAFNAARPGTCIRQLPASSSQGIWQSAMCQGLPHRGLTRPRLMSPALPSGTAGRCLCSLQRV